MCDSQECDDEAQPTALDAVDPDLLLALVLPER